MGWCEKCEADCNPCGCIDDEIVGLREERNAAVDQRTEFSKQLSTEIATAARLRRLLGQCVGWLEVVAENCVDDEEDEESILDLISLVKKELAPRAVCHCGEYCDEHTEASGHTAVAMEPNDS